MKDEVSTAVSFISKIIRNKNRCSDIISDYEQTLTSLIMSHYEDHWFPEKPFKGSAYRCIRIVNKKMDPLLSRAGSAVGLSDESLLLLFPEEFTMWIDPNEVSYRIGEDGSIGILYDQKNSSNVINTDYECHSPMPLSCKEQLLARESTNRSRSKVRWDAVAPTYITS